MAEKKQHALWFWLGFLVMALTVIPNLILGEDSIFTYHDQLDGELIAYILQARHLFSGDLLPEFMGGMSKTALVMPAPACVLLFLGGNGFAALTVMQLAGRLVGYAGMYLLVREKARFPWIGAGAGILYGLLPFLPVYGLAQYGIPMLFWCALQLRKGQHLVAAYCYVAAFGLTSSLVLVGFGLLGMGVVVFLWDLGKKRKPWHFLAAWQLLLCIYGAENFRLFAQLLGAGEGGISHKTEYALAARPFWGTFLESLVIGGQHSEGYHGGLVAVMLVTVAVAAVLKGGGQRTKAGMNGGWIQAGEQKTIGLCLGWNVLFAVTAALWNSGIGTGLRSGMGAMGAFQLDRLLWIAPCFWYLAAACGMAVLWDSWRQCRGDLRRIGAGGCVLILAVAAGITGVKVLSAGDIKSNLRKLISPDYDLLSYGDYYAIGVMEQVRDYLWARTGKGQEAYRVVSLGIDPAAALYHGFYCLDGYSNNYSLDYKHRFREVIEPELEKSEYLRNYFDTWGNRCYLFSAECPGYYTIEKNGFYFRDYRINIGALKEMGCDFLFSAAYIQNADSQGLVLLNEVPFETENSYYRIFVYEIAEEERKQ